MKTITIQSKNYGTQRININSFNHEMAATSSTIFKVVEHIFNDWFDHNTQPGAPLAKDIEGCYFGYCDQPAIYSKKGAIREGIGNLINEAIESGKSLLTTKDILKMDIEAAFEI